MAELRSGHGRTPHLSLPRLFLVMATQNRSSRKAPIRCPRRKLDRFLMRARRLPERRVGAEDPRAGARRGARRHRRVPTVWATVFRGAQRDPRHVRRPGARGVRRAARARDARSKPYAPHLASAVRCGASPARHDRARALRVRNTPGCAVPSSSRPDDKARRREGTCCATACCSPSRPRPTAHARRLRRRAARPPCRSPERTVPDRQSWAEDRTHGHGIVASVARAGGATQRRGPARRDAARPRAHVARRRHTHRRFAAAAWSSTRRASTSRATTCARHRLARDRTHRTRPRRSSTRSASGLVLMLGRPAAARLRFGTRTRSSRGRGAPRRRWAMGGTRSRRPRRRTDRRRRTPLCRGLYCTTQRSRAPPPLPFGAQRRDRVARTFGAGTHGSHELPPPPLADLRPPGAHHSRPAPLLWIISDFADPTTRFPPAVAPRAAAGSRARARTTRSRQRCRRRTRTA